MFASLPYITFWVRHFDAVVKFYRDLLGLEVEQLNEGFVRFRTASGFMLAFHAAYEARVSSPAPEIHFEAPDVDAAYRDLKARGVRFNEAPADMPWGQRMAVCRDPEGHSVEIVGPVNGNPA